MHFGLFEENDNTCNSNGEKKPPVIFARFNWPNINSCLQPDIKVCC